MTALYRDTNRFREEGRHRSRGRLSVKNFKIRPKSVNSIRLFIPIFRILFFALFALGITISAEAESRLIYGVPFGLTSLEQVSDGIYQVEVMGRTEIVPAAKIDQVVFDAYFDSPLAKTAAPLPGLSGGLLKDVVLEAARRGEVKNSLIALKKLVLQIDVKSSETVALLYELIGIPGREVVHQFLQERDALILQPTALAPLLMKLLSDDAQFLRISARDLMERVLGAMRRRFVSEELAEMLKEPSKADDRSQLSDSYAKVYGFTDDGRLDLELLKEEISFVWNGVRSNNLTSLAVVPLLIEQAHGVLLPEDVGLTQSFLLKLSRELELLGKFDESVRLLVSIPFDRRTPILHQALAASIEALVPSENSVLLDSASRAALFNYGLVDERLKVSLEKSSTKLIAFLLQRGDFEVAHEIVRDVSSMIGGWTPQLVGQALDVVSLLSRAGSAEAARQALSSIQGRVGVLNYPRYLWLRIFLGASAKHLLLLAVYLLFVAMIYIYVRWLNASRVEAIDSAFKEETKDLERPAFVQYWHHSSPLLAEYVRNLQILKLRPGASPAEIKHNYREGVRQFRALLDKGRDLHATEELMKIQAAYKRVQEIESSPLFAGLLRTVGSSPDSLAGKRGIPRVDE
jgi:hypothetical protein